VTDKRCPRCDLWNTGSALRCDCGYDFRTNTIEESYSKKEVSKSAKRKTRDILFGAIIGLFVFGIILEPAAIYLARKARKTLTPTDDGYNHTVVAEIIAWIGLVLWLLGCFVFFTMIILNQN
jgi:uncharacterized Tic20 family protein